jgi:hypothetical protein
MIKVKDYFGKFVSIKIINSDNFIQNSCVNLNVTLSENKFYEIRLFLGENMKNVFSFLTVGILLITGLTVFAQNKAPSRYEVEILANPNANQKDTREVNSIIIFESDKVIVQSRRSSEVFKEIKYSDIKFVEHSLSRKPWLSQAAKSFLSSWIVGFPYWFGNDEKHWLTVISSNDFFVLKLENDNYRQIKAEFVIRNIEVANIKEGKDDDKSKSKDNNKSNTTKEETQN